MAGIKWAIALRFGAERNLKLRIKAADGQEAGSIDLGLALSSERAGTTEVPPHATYAGSMFVDPTAWTVLLFDVNSQPPMLITQPGHYTVFKVQADGAEIQIGSFNVLLLNALPLDATRIAAIRSDPQAAKAVRIELSCKNCSSKLRAFAALDKKPEQDGYLWYGDIPDTFDCECGGTHLDVRTIKYNLHGLLGHPVSVSSSEIAFSPLYERSALLEVRRLFIELLDRDAAEEEIQKFIQENPILLHQFPAEKLFFKPAILTFFKADFAVVTPQKELILIEIENTRTRLMNKAGDAAQPLSHSIDQVRNWLHVADEHRLAVLAALGVDQVSSINGAVIAGRDAPYEPEHLRRLKGFDRGRVTLLTFDDVAASLASLADRFRTL
jgi:antiviral defense system Shedu protein SduA